MRKTSYAAVLLAVSAALARASSSSTLPGQATLPAEPRTVVSPDCPDDTADAATDATNATVASVEALPDRKHRRGDLVEVLDPSVHPTLSFAAQISHVTSDPSTGLPLWYVVRPGFGRQSENRRPLPPSSILGELRDFDDVEVATCDVGSALNEELVECTIMEHDERARAEHVKKRKSYGVRYVDGERREVKSVMPISRIRRTVEASA